MIPRSNLLSVAFVLVIVGVMLLLSAAQCGAQDRAMVTMRIAIATGSAADAITTVYGLKRGAREGNRFMRQIVESPPALAAVKVGAFVATDFALSKLAKRNRKAALVTGWILTGWYASVAVHNARIQRQRR